MEVLRTEITKSAFLLGITNIVKRDHKDIRQESKGKTFKLNYGGFPDINKGGTITQEIFDNYHNVLYPGITAMREITLAKAEKDKELHLGLGWWIKTDNPKDDIRTLFNGLSQFWSILSLLAINKFHSCVDEEGLQEQVEVIASIYDSIYLQVEEKAETIKWVNDTIIPIMIKDFMLDQVVPLAANGEVGMNWCDLVEIPNGASTEEIKEVLNEL